MEGYIRSQIAQIIQKEIDIFDHIFLKKKICSRKILTKVKPISKLRKNIFDTYN